MPLDRDQARTPYLDALIRYRERDPGRFMVPGHKGGTAADPGLREAIGEAGLSIDIPAGVEGIDVGSDLSSNFFQQAQQLAAEAWGAKRTWFLVNGGSGGNHAICLALAHTGNRVIVQRNAHSSTIDGLILAGLRPHFVSPEVDTELGIAHCLTPDALQGALAEFPDAVAVMITSPTYFGAVADVATLAEIAHDARLPLVVDEAWGAHLRFSPEVPASAIELGADLVLSSTHKIVGSLTQSAMLHLGETGARVDERVVDRAVTLIESTSPSALLTASLDAARRQAVTHGAELLAETVSSLREIRDQVRAIPGLDVLDERLAGRPGVFAYDPMRLVVDVRGTGATGHRIANLLREADDVDVELFAENVVVAAFGLGEHVGETGQRLVGALRKAVKSAGESDQPSGRFAEPPPWGPTELSPREAFLGRQEVIPFDEAEGRIAAESLAAYPPGVPNVLPGERLTGPTLAYISDSIAHGGWVRGASDRSLKTIRVVVEVSNLTASTERSGDQSQAEQPWGVDSETGVLRDVLLCPPDNFQWGPTSAISRATLESGRAFDAAAAKAQHADLVAAYEDAGVRCHYLEPDPALIYQVFTRDSSVGTPWGGFVTAPAQTVRRGEYGPVMRFYTEAGIPIWNVATAGSIEGGDVMIVEPGSIVIGTGELRTELKAARQLASLFEAEGWEARVQPIPGVFVHIDVLMAVVADKLAAVCTEVLPGGLVTWLRDKGFEILDVPVEDAWTLGVNAMSLGGDRVLTGARATTLNEQMAARGLELLAPDLEMFTLGGGGAHCLGQALRRDRVG